MTEGEFEGAVCGRITDELLTQQGHSTEVSEKRSALFKVIMDWRVKYHHACEISLPEAFAGLHYFVPQGDGTTKCQKCGKVEPIKLWGERG
jgi:hypothetical protein